MAASRAAHLGQLRRRGCSPTNARAPEPRGAARLLRRTSRQSL